jgi:hypothetical protein
MDVYDKRANFAVPCNLLSFFGVIIYWFIVPWYNLFSNTQETFIQFSYTFC